uniref:Uncharacterized protein n=1 Tax=Kalanchoe fedtschenkoi TaxID=63787 RepID=A0A7N0UG51_KALFE
MAHLIRIQHRNSDMEDDLVQGDNIDDHRDSSSLLEFQFHGSFLKYFYTFSFSIKLYYMRLL